MSMALALGRRGLGRTWPNPSVGCILVKNGIVIGRGRTADGGRPHAEVVALKEAGTYAEGATAYITLEPCSHIGRSSACTEALIKAKVARVVAAVEDKDNRVKGEGFAKLRAAGIHVTTGIGLSTALEDHQGFFNRVIKGRPFLTLKLAMSFDGRIATASGQSKWITDMPARRLVHALRAQYDAVMVGGGTARKDNPSLTVRGLGIEHKVVRIVLSSKLDLPMDSKLAKSAKSIPLWLCHSTDVKKDCIEKWEELGAKLFECDTTEGMLDTENVLKQVAGHGLTRVFCEGGGALSASLIKAQLVDEIIGFNSGLFIGADGQPAIAPLGVKDLQSQRKFILMETKKIGPDVMQRWRRSP